jgi:hypothetical protein
MYDTEAEARKDWQSIAPAYRTRERLEEMLAQVRSTATTLECTRCGNTRPRTSSRSSPAAIRATRFPRDEEARNPAAWCLDGARCMVCAERVR